MKVCLILSWLLENKKTKYFCPSWFKTTSVLKDLLIKTDFNAKNATQEQIPYQHTNLFAFPIS